MSVSASRTVSTDPASMALRSSSRVMAAEGIGRDLSRQVGCPSPDRAGRVAACPASSRPRWPAWSRARPARGRAGPLDGGITNRNYRVTLGGEPLVVRLRGKRTGPLGIDRDTECLAAERAAGARHRAAGGRPAARRGRAWSASFLEAAPSTPSGCAARGARRGRAGAARLPRRRRRCPRRSPSSGSSRTSAALGAARPGRSRPSARARRARIERSAAGRRARPGPVPQRPAGRRTCCDAGEGCGSSTGSTRA